MPPNRFYFKSLEYKVLNIHIKKVHSFTDALNMFDVVIEFKGDGERILFSASSEKKLKEKINNYASKTFKSPPRKLKIR